MKAQSPAMLCGDEVLPSAPSIKNGLSRAREEMLCLDLSSYHALEGTMVESMTVIIKARHVWRGFACPRTHSLEIW